jgi:phosphatidylserine decarboxylase
LRLFARGGEGTILLFTAFLAGTAWMRHKLPRPVGDLLLLLILPLWGLVLFFFRDPERTLPAGDELILSPADGRIVAIERVHEPLVIQGPAVRLSTFMSLWDVHVNRSPVSGEVKLVRHVPGKFLQAFRPEAPDVNEHILMGLQSGERRVLVKQIAGILARRCVNRAIIGEHLERGQRFGLIRFSSRVDLFLPPEVELLVQVGDAVQGGRSVVAHWSSAQEEAT